MLLLDDSNITKRLILFVTFLRLQFPSGKRLTKSHYWAIPLNHSYMVLSFCLFVFIALAVALSSPEAVVCELLQACQCKAESALALLAESLVRSLCSRFLVCLSIFLWFLSLSFSFSFLILSLYFLFVPTVFSDFLDHHFPSFFLPFLFPGVVELFLSHFSSLCLLSCLLSVCIIAFFSLFRVVIFFTPAFLFAVALCSLPSQCRPTVRSHCTIHQLGLR